MFQILAADEGEREAMEVSLPNSDASYYRDAFDNAHGEDVGVLS
jgi:hypothetical protein